MKRYFIVFLLSVSVLSLRAQTIDLLPTDTIERQVSFADSTVYMPVTRMPFTPLSASWYLHDGLNLQFSAAATVSIGRNRFPGALFSTQTSGAYVFPVTSRFRLVGGLYVDSYNWNGWHDYCLGVTGMGVYQLSEKVAVGAYASKRLLPVSKRLFPLSTWGWHRYDYNFGGMLHVKCNDVFSFTVRVEGGK